MRTAALTGLGGSLQNKHPGAIETMSAQPRAQAYKPEPKKPELCGTNERYIRYGHQTGMPEAFLPLFAAVLAVLGQVRRIRPVDRRHGPTPHHL